jgi:ornithine carbamoyltransferase
MNNFLNISDIDGVSELINEAILLKKDPFQFCAIGKHKTLVMLFFNASLRTRLSTEKAAKNLGMEVMILNLGEPKLNTLKRRLMSSLNTPILLQYDHSQDLLIKIKMLQN